MIARLGPKMKKPRLDRDWMKLECGNEKGPPKRAFEFDLLGDYHVVTFPLAMQYKQYRTLSGLMFMSAAP